MWMRVMQGVLRRFGASRRRDHVRRRSCGRLSQNAAAAADTPLEATIPVSNEEEPPGEPAYQTTRPRPSRSFRSASSLMSSTGALRLNTWVHWFNLIWTAFARRTSPIAHSHMLLFVCSRCVRYFDSPGGRRRGASSSRSMAPALRSRSRHACAPP